MRKIVFVFACLVGITTLHAQVLYGTTSAGGINGKSTICQSDRNTGKLTAIFTFEYADGFNPAFSNLVQAKDGKLYGMTPDGGSTGGIIFSYNPVTAVYTPLKDFNDTDGYHPLGSLMQATDGKLYGMTIYGGANGWGVIFSFDPATNSYTKMKDFTTIDGSNPQGSLIQAKDGLLYGMTANGGNYGRGVIFSFNSVSHEYTKLKDFQEFEGEYANGSLIQAADGKLYGMTANGGTNDQGVLFSFDPANGSYIKLKDFDVASGYYPYGSLMQGKNGKLYGMTFFGGTYNSGVIFSYNPVTAGYTKESDFAGYNGEYPYGSLMQASDGKLYGMTYQGGQFDKGVVFSFSPATHTYTLLMDFNDDNGAYPEGSLIQAADGKFYGMATNGGSSSTGTLFSFNPVNAQYNKLRDFGLNGTGSDVAGGVVSDSTGKLYGMTTNGGAYGRGVLFSYNTADAAYSKLFDLDYANGGNPMGSLTLVANGNLYGMAYNGGTNERGVIFSFNPATRVYTKIKDFDYRDGSNPYGNLIQTKDGKLYGMTESGGSNGKGVIFCYNPVTAVYTKLKDFTGTDGGNPKGSLIRANNGKLYGMTTYGGSYGCGVLFSYNLSTAVYTKLLDFNTLDGACPTGSLLEAKDGKLYGMTANGGQYGGGVLFSFNPSTSIYTKLRDFVNTTGNYPMGSLMQRTDGKLYGMTNYGGTYSNGVTFSFNPATNVYKKLQDFNGANGKYPTYTFFTEVISPAQIKINNTSIQEGDSGEQNMTFTVTLSAASSQVITVSYKTKNGTATAPADFVAKTGTLTFAPGVKKQTISVLINGDSQAEGDEKFKVLLGNAVNSNIEDSIGVGTILDDDAGFTLPSVASIESNRPTEIAVSPNPATNIINVQLKGYIGSTTLQLTDIRGKVLKEIKLQTSNMKNAQQIDISGIASGTYLIIFLDEKGHKQMRKIIVKH